MAKKKISAVNSGKVTCDASPKSLVPFLGHSDGWVRHHARECLVKIGTPAIPCLVKALRNRNEDIRWEAAKALSQIPDTRIAPALIRALFDENFGVRWLAAEGLVNIGYAALPPLLWALIKWPDSPLLQQGAHHVLRLMKDKGIASEQIRPLLNALDGFEPNLQVPIAAGRLLDEMVGRSKYKPMPPITRLNSDHLLY